MGLSSRCAAGLLLTLITVAAPLSSAYSEFTRVYAGSIKGLCTSDDLIMKSWCEGFISGELEIISNSPVEGITACVPHLVNLPRGIAVVKKWFADHPEEPMAQSASLAVARALAEAYPCEK
jgi:hypothetical protein